MQERPNSGYDLAVRVTVPEALAELVGAVLMDFFGPFQWERSTSCPDCAHAGLDQVILTFYPPDAPEVTADRVLALLPRKARAEGVVQVAIIPVSREWEQGWKRYFCPTVIGGVLVRPPWGRSEMPSEGAALTPDSSGRLVEVVINPGLGFGTGQHPTTRGVLTLLQKPLAHSTADQVPEGRPPESCSGLTRGPLVDVGTGSGILAIAAAKLGWSPVLAFDHDSQALLSAKENIEANGVKDVVTLCEADLETAPIRWFAGATVLANVTLGPVLILVKRLGSELANSAKPVRLIVSGILAGEQEESLLDIASSCGFACDTRLYEAEWVSMELVPRG